MSYVMPPIGSVTTRIQAHYSHYDYSSMSTDTPLVGIIMGSKSDWDAMKAASEMLAKFGVAHESRVMSAHRTPAVVTEYVSGAIGRGMEIIIAGAGGAAHL